MGTSFPPTGGVRIPWVNEVEMGFLCPHTGLCKIRDIPKKINLISFHPNVSSAHISSFLKKMILGL